MIKRKKNSAIWHLYSLHYFFHFLPYCVESWGPTSNFLLSSDGPPPRVVHNTNTVHTKPMCNPHIAPYSIKRTYNSKIYLVFKKKSQLHVFLVYKSLNLSFHSLTCNWVNFCTFFHLKLISVYILAVQSAT